MSTSTRVVNALLRSRVLTKTGKGGFGFGLLYRYRQCLNTVRDRANFDHLIYAWGTWISLMDLRLLSIHVFYGH